MAQVACSLLLLIGAGLVWRSLEKARPTRLGFSTDNILVAPVVLDTPVAREVYRDAALYVPAGDVTAAIEECAVVLQSEAATGEALVLSRTFEEVSERDAAAQARHRSLRVAVTAVKLRPALIAGSADAVRVFERLDEIEDAVEDALEAHSRDTYPALLRATGADLIALVSREPMGLPEDDYFARSLTYELRRSRQ